MYGGNAIAQSELENIRDKFVAESLAPSIDESSVERWMNTIGKNGSWPDINYEDVSRTGFENATHLRRLVALCRAYKKGPRKLQDNKELKIVIDKAISFWVANDFICDNWWWNQIGTPSAFIKVLFIMDDDLSKGQIAKILPIVERATLKQIPGKFYGARESGDRIKIAGIVAKRLLFERDSIKFDKVMGVIENEIKFTTGRGMQYDYSFHHRNDRVNNTLSYGTQYANVLAEWAASVSGTKYRFSDSSMHKLVDYYLDGICKMLVYGRYPDPGAKNRAITRRGALDAYSAVTPERLLEATDYRRGDLEKIVEIRKGEAHPTLSFSRFYWQSEHFTFQRPDFFTSVRMYSDRCDNMEQPYNGEGLMNHYRGDGTNYISRTGNEYDYLSPVYDWQKIPGATIMQRKHMPPPDEIQKRGLTDFVGAVTDGKYGAVAFDFKSPIDPLKAKKAWFFFDDEYVCLGAGITGGSSLPVVTTLNQCRLEGNVVVKTDGRKWRLEEGVHQIDSVKWILHDSIGYLFPEAIPVNLSNQAQKGSWYKVNHQEDSPKKEVSKDVFKLWISHGSHPEDAAYKYIIVPATSEREMKRKSKDNEVEVLSNTVDIQAVMDHRLNIFEGVFYSPGKMEISKNLKVIMHDPGIVMLKTDGYSIKSISVEDPTRKLSSIHLSVSARINRGKNKNAEIYWDKTKGVSNIVINLPQSVYSGKSITIIF